MKSPHSHWRCASCGRQNQADFAFCPKCGTRLSTRQPMPSPHSSPSSPNGISNKTVGGIVAGLTGFGFLLMLIAVSSTTPSRTAGSPESPTSPLASPSPLATLEIAETMPGRKGKASPIERPSPRVREEARRASTPSRDTSYSPAAVAPSRHSSGYITGPRGGCYYINGNGNKTYADRDMCGGTVNYSRPPTSTRRGYITGPRGGCYYINGNGNKTYVDHSFCR